ncbi:hypothetical protein OCU04_005379 [Sclerotinia nivalis]|uniref:Uncharacterized protein n=1 Tax=Sclerotinia nivalis TaxID=352851 RepID=A0A9X0DL49_9HELO|nr:hypothetical protein OCU04_005379 [Sclerotinia nivalis]
MADSSSTLYAKAMVEAQKTVHYVLDKAPGAYESGKEAAVTVAAKIQPALNSAVEKTPILIQRSKVVARQLYQDAPRYLGTAKVAARQLYQDAPRHLGTAKVAARQLYQDAPRHLGTAKVAAGQLYQDTPRHLNTAKQAGMRALEDPSQSARSLLDIVGPIVRQHPYVSGFVVWAALAVKFGTFWPVRALFRIFGFGKGVTPGSSAASWQSRQVNVQRNSWFSLFQSCGDRLN